MKTKIKKWLGSEPKTCDLCHKPFTKAFVDGKTSYGPWGLLCVARHKTWGVGLGLGKGQKYDLKTLILMGGS